MNPFTQVQNAPGAFSWGGVAGYGSLIASAVAGTAPGPMTKTFASALAMVFGALAAHLH